MTPADQQPAPLPESAFLQEPAPPSRMRRRMLIGALIAAGVVGGVCVAGCLVLSVMTDAQRLSSAADVQRIANEIAPITIPSGYTGELAEVVKTPFFAVRKVVFRQESGKGVLSIVELKLPVRFAEQDAEVERSLFDSFVTDMRQIAATDESQRSMTIRNVPAEFQLRSGRDTLSSTQLHEVRGVFHGQNGLAQLWLQAEDSVWDAESVDEMLNSLAD